MILFGQKYYFLLLLFLLCACAAPVTQADPVMPVASATPVPATQTATPTATVTPRPTATATPIPTIVIPILTQTVTPTIVPVETASPVMFDTVPERVIPEPFGMEIHFTRPLPGELNLMTAAGFRWVRMDLFWNVVEPEMGRYDFQEYDALVAALTARDIRIVFILDYGNPFYDGGYAPHSPEARAAFARFAAAAARRYRDKGIVWEIWNEPNLDQFWGPHADVERYGALLLQTVAAIRRADPTAFIVAPGTSGFDWPFWTALGDMGAFTKLDAVTVHPYGVAPPEQVGPYYVHLARLLHRYSPAWKIPVLSSESGYSSMRGGFTEEQQAQFLVRHWLINLVYDVNLSIWYDWRNNGVEPDNLEHNFGVVQYDFTRKPSYYAAQTLLTTLDGYRFMRRIPLESQHADASNDYLLLFAKDGQAALALWTTGEPHQTGLPLALDEVPVVLLMGERRVLSSVAGVLTVDLDRSPRYLLLGAEQTVSPLIAWRPYETLQHLRASEGYSVRVIFEGLPLSTFGEVQVRVAGEVRGTADIVTRPMETQHARVPVDVTGLSGAVPAELVFVSSDGALSPLQTAMIWLLLDE